MSSKAERLVGQPIPWLLTVFLIPVAISHFAYEYFMQELVITMAPS